MVLRKLQGNLMIRSNTMYFIKQFQAMPLIALMLLSFPVNTALAAPQLDVTANTSEVAVKNVALKNVAVKNNAINAQWLAYSNHNGAPLAWNPVDIAGVDFRSQSPGGSALATPEFDKRGKTIASNASEFNNIDELSSVIDDSFTTLNLWPGNEGSISTGIALALAAIVWLLMSTLAVLFMAKRDKSTHPHILVTVKK
nr:hypothetical protein [uncultured bacterium]